MNFYCTHCGHAIAVDDPLAGQEVGCPYCHATTRAPAMPSSTAPPMRPFPPPPLPPAYLRATTPVDIYSARNLGPSHLGIAVAGFVLAFIVPPLGMIFSWHALSQMSNDHNDEGKGLATAGGVIGGTITALSCLAFLAVCSGGSMC